MSEQLWVAILLVVAWASLPISLVVANKTFDKDVCAEGEDPFHH